MELQQPLKYTSIFELLKNLLYNDTIQNEISLLYNKLKDVTDIYIPLIMFDKILCKGDYLLPFLCESLIEYSNLYDYIFLYILPPTFTPVNINYNINDINMNRKVYVLNGNKLACILSNNNIIDLKTSDCFELDGKNTCSIVNFSKEHVFLILFDKCLLDNKKIYKNII